MKTIFCDACGQRFEGAAAGSNCPVCGAGMLVVEESKPTESELAEKMAEEQRRKTIHEAERIEDNAVILSFVGKVALLVFAFALLAMFLCEGSAYWLSLWIASAALTIFFGLQILAQLLYIRAKLTARCIGVQIRCDRLLEPAGHKQMNHNPLKDYGPPAARKRAGFPARSTIQNPFLVHAWHPGCDHNQEGREDAHTPVAAFQGRPRRA